MKNKWNKRTSGSRALVWAWSVPVAVLLLASALAPPLQAAQRPIEDFLSSQGKYSSSWLFGMWWIDPFVTDGAYSAEIDYAGLKGAIMEYYGYPPLGTTFSGTVNERPLPDGRAEVEVVLRTRNALAWAAGPDNEYLFGHDFVEVFNGASLALGDCTLQLRFINTAPNAPLPDFWELVMDPQWELLSVYFIGTAHGLMADGSPGVMQITQVGLEVVSPPKPPFFDGYPAEHILLKRVGKKGASTPAAVD